MSERNVVDSSGWLEYFVDSDRAQLYAPAIEDLANLIVPTIAIYEVVKKVIRERGEAAAKRAADKMRLARVVGLDAQLALEAARFSLPLADSIIYATAVRFKAALWTQDEHFEGLANVRYFRK